MSRSSDIDYLRLDAAQREFVSSIVNSPRTGTQDEHGHLKGVFGALVRNPVIGRPAAELGAALRFNGTLAPALRELATLAVVARWQAGYEWAAHVRAAEAAGIEAELCTAVGTGDPCGPEGSASEVVVRAVRMLLADGALSDEALDRVVAVVGEAGLVELTVLVGYYTAVCCTLNVFEIPGPVGVSLPWKSSE